jgi:hypothetical protein
MTVYEPAEGFFGGSRPPCANCGAVYRLHRGVTMGTDKIEHPECPAQVRLTDRLTDAVELLRRADDPGKAFMYRGEVQRLMDHRPIDPAHCPACAVLLSKETL